MKLFLILLNIGCLLNTLNFVNCDTSSSLAIFPTSIADLCIDLFSEDFTYKPSKDTAPFNVTSKVILANNNDEINVELSIKSGNVDLRGFLVRAETDKGGNKEEIVGRFEPSFNPYAANTSSVYFYRCFPKIYGNPNLAYRNDLYANLSDKSVILTWTGPNYSGIQFRMTLVNDAENYWINVIHKIENENEPEPYNEKTSYEIISKTYDNLITNSDCGSSKGCIFWPKVKRNIENTYAFVSYKRFNKYIRFELAVLLPNTATNEYAKLSIINLDESKTHVAKNDYSLAILCGVSNSDESNMQIGFYNKTNFIRIPIIQDNIIKNTEVYLKTTENGRKYLNCKFYIRTEIYVNIQPTSLFKYDLAKKAYRIAINTGSYYENTNIALKTIKYPFISNEKIFFDKNSIHYGSAFNLSIQLHIIFELIAWMLLNQIALIINCYFRYGQFFGETNSSKHSPRYFLWFNVLTFIVLIFSWGGIIMMFYHYNEYILKLTDKHCLFGLITLALNVIQCIYIIVNGILKTKPNSCIHDFSVFIGWLAQIFSIVTMFFAAFLPQLNELFKSTFLTIIIVYTVFEVLKVFIFQVTNTRRKRYLLVTHKINKVFRNANAPGYLILYLSVVEILTCILSYSYYIIIY